jgi:hypothetical protein
LIVARHSTLPQDPRSLCCVADIYEVLRLPHPFPINTIS